MQKPAVSIVHLGCPKNLIDTEKILGNLASDDYIIAQTPEISDLVIINTCGFLESARKEGKETIESIIQMKKDKQIKCVVVAGCMVQMCGKELLAEFPEIDGLIGFCDYKKIGEYIKSIWNKEKR